MTSRKIFGTDGIRGTANAWPVTPEMAMRLGMAAATYFRKSDPRQRCTEGSRIRSRVAPACNPARSREVTVEVKVMCPVQMGLGIGTLAGLGIPEQEPAVGNYRRP